MKEKRVLRFLLCAAAILLFATGCRSPGSNGKDTAEQTTSGTGAEETYLDIVKDGQAVKIIYPLASESEDLSRAQSLANDIYRLTDVKPRIADDWLKPGDSHDSETVEILLGDTNYAETEQAYNTLGYGQGACKVIGNKVVLVGSGYALDQAINDFLVALGETRDEGKNVRISGTFDKRSVANEQIARVPNVEGCKYPRIEECGDSCYELIFEDATAEIFNAYLQKMGAAGFAAYAENEIDGNRFLTYTDGESQLHLSLVGGKKLLITTEPLAKSALPGKPEENLFETGSCETQLSQIGLCYGATVDANGYTTTSINGMCYVYRLCDGSFIIIDGGSATDGNADRLYAFLQKQAPDPENIVIAAWIFSHDHSDHVGAFCVFAKKYSESVTVERFLFNFPGDSQCTTKSGYGEGAIVKGSIRKYYPAAVIHKVHAGQVFYIRNATVRILLTLEVMQPHTLTYYNNTSVVMQIEAEDVKTLFLGDCGSDEQKDLLKFYFSGTLKSDVLQVAHHGINGCDSDLYGPVAAAYAFIPVGADKIIVDGTKIDSIINKPINQYVKKLSATPGRVFMAKDDVVVFTLKNGSVQAAETYGDMEAFLQSS